jgi:hypothetical protein
VKLKNNKMERPIQLKKPFVGGMYKGLVEFRQLWQHAYLSAKLDHSVGRVPNLYIDRA